MITSYKGRDIKPGQKVKVYFNLRKKVFSIKDHKTGVVLAHGNNIAIRDPEFLVSEAGRQRVLREKQKNVHAFVVGSFEGITELDRPVKSQYDRVKYDPYKVNQFMVGDSLVPANRKQYEFALLENKTILAR